MNRFNTAPITEMAGQDGSKLAKPRPEQRASQFSTRLREGAAITPSLHPTRVRESAAAPVGARTFTPP
jgi:hypothetical protein